MENGSIIFKISAQNAYAWNVYYAWNQRRTDFMRVESCRVFDCILNTTLIVAYLINDVCEA